MFTSWIQNALGLGLIFQYAARREEQPAQDFFMQMFLIFSCLTPVERAGFCGWTSCTKVVTTGSLMVLSPLMIQTGTSQNISIVYSIPLTCKDAELYSDRITVIGSVSLGRGGSAVTHHPFCSLSQWFDQDVSGYVLFV